MTDPRDGDGALDPNTPDSEGDALSDDDELNTYGTDPNDAGSYPTAQGHH